MLARLLRALAFVVAPFVLVACISPMTPTAKLNDAVQDMNYSARFGQTEVTLEHVAPDARKAFTKRHASWGHEVRIVDVELGGLEKMTSAEATVMVSYSWFRPSEGELRSTTVRQTWVNDAGKGAWKLQNEERADGDVGLLGEKAVVVLKPEHKDAHFETTTIPGGSGY